MNSPWLPSDPLPTELFRRLRSRAIFECCKWDPQVEDVSTLSPTPLILREEEWTTLAAQAESLARETLAAEAELAVRPDLHDRLGLPRPVRKALRAVADMGPSRGAARLMRFDFHHTTEGWRISEVNSDVPGGFNEASGFTKLICEQFPSCAIPGDPARQLAQAIARTVETGSTVALAHATAFTDDRQVMVFLARELGSLGVRAVLVSPDHLRWHEGFASVRSDWFSGPVPLVFRFFPAEWLPNLPRDCGWRHFFAGARTPLSNPASALLTQSKRFPLIWDQLKTPLPMWRRLLPETRDPREVNWQENPDWLLKPACGRVGELIGLRGVTTAKDWRLIAKGARRDPGYWVAQRRFEAVPIVSHDGAERFPCLGIFTVDGRAAGAYGRIAHRPIIDHLAQDAAVLLAPEQTMPAASGHSARLPFHAPSDTAGLTTSHHGTLAVI